MEAGRAELRSLFLGPEPVISDRTEGTAVEETLAYYRAAELEKILGVGTPSMMLDGPRRD